MLIGTYAVYYFFWREMHDITADVSEKVAVGKEDAGDDVVEKEETA